MLRKDPSQAHGNGRALFVGDGTQYPPTGGPAPICMCHVYARVDENQVLEENPSRVSHSEGRQREPKLSLLFSGFFARVWARN